MSRHDFELWTECDLCGEVLSAEEFDNVAESLEGDSMNVCDTCMNKACSPDYNVGFED